MSDRDHEPKATLATLASSHAHLDQAHRSPRCMHVRSNGVRCGSPAMRRNAFCFFHDRWLNQPAEDTFPPLEDSNAVQVALMQVLDRLRREALRPGPLDLRAVNSLLYGLQTAAFNSKRTSFDSFASRREIVTDDPIVSDREDREAVEANAAADATEDQAERAPARKDHDFSAAPDSLGAAPAAPRQPKPAPSGAEGPGRKGPLRAAFRQR